MRKSIGSIPHFSASSSITVSEAIAALVAPGARYAAVFGRLTTTSYASITKLGISYGAIIVIAPAPTGDPGKAPASNAIQISAATSLPSLVAPILHRMVEPDVGPVARKTSPRVITSFTGQPVFFDNRSARGSR